MALWCSRVAHSQPILGMTNAATASCLLARGRPVQLHPIRPQIIPRSRETRLGSLVDAMKQKRTRPRIEVKCKPAEQKGNSKCPTIRSEFSSGTVDVAARFAIVDLSYGPQCRRTRMIRIQFARSRGSEIPLRPCSR